MRAALILTCAVSALCMSAAAAAADLAEGEMAPGLHVSFAFGGAAHGAPLRLQSPADPAAALIDPRLNAAESEGLSSTTTWIIVGVVVAGVVIIASQNHGGGGTSGGGY